MTTKKQRRANVAAKRAAFDASYRADGLAALKRSNDRAEQRRFDAEREANKKTAKAIINDMAKSSEKIVPGTGVAYDA